MAGPETFSFKHRKANFTIRRQIPQALHNIAVTSKGVGDTLQSQLDSFWRKTSDGESATAKLGPAQEENLRALGYLPATTAAPTAKKGPAIDVRG